MTFKHRLWGDFETSSAIPIAHGTYRYAEDSDPLIMTYALDDGEVHAWQPALNEPMPKELDEMLLDPGVELAFHNAAFDRSNMLAWGWGSRYPLHGNRFYCTMTLALMCKMPGGLDALGLALGLPEQYTKKDGNRLIQLFCVPRADGSYVQPHDAWDDWQKFLTYAKHDIVSMRECARRLPEWVYNRVERDIYGYTSLMNDRGVAVDRELATAAVVQADEIKRRLKAAAAAHAMDAVRDAWGSQDELLQAQELNPASQKAILDFIKGFGVILDDARANTIEKFLDSPKAELVPDNIRQLLATRLKLNKTSVAKYSTVLTSANTDGRLRGLIKMYGAGTGRDAGVKFQPQNLARPVVVREANPAKNDPGLSMEEACDIVKRYGTELLFSDPMQVLSDCVRGVLVPAPGRKFCGADLSAIEGRVLPWLAREDDVTQYFRDFDAGVVKYDGYQLAYATAFGVDPSTVTKAQRTLGKPVDLASGFGGGVGALLTFAAVYGIDAYKMAAAAREAADPYLWQECDSSYDWYKKKRLDLGLPRDVFVGCLYIIKAWRSKRPKTVQLWGALEAAFRNAIANPGVSFEGAYRTHLMNVNGWVFMQLPSGRCLVYPDAHIDSSGACAFTGVNPFTRKVGVLRTYSGRLAENVTQAVARDVLFWNIPHVENAGYPIVMRIHDELLTEPPDSPQFSGAHLAKLMSQPHAWCPDLPLAAVGEDLYRFQK